MDLNLCGSYLVYNIYPTWIEPYESYTEFNYVTSYSMPFELYKNHYTYSLSLNPNSIKYLEKYPYKINWYSLSKNENAIEFIRPEITKSNSKIIWRELSANPNPEILKFLKNNPDKINIETICFNKNPEVKEIINLLIKLDANNFNKIRWDFLRSKNILEIDTTNWYELSKNKNAISLLKNNPDNIKWKYLSLNENPEAIDLIRYRLLYKKDLSEFDWIVIAGLSNYNAIELIKENINDIINYCKEKNILLYFIDNFYKNPFIFTVNFEFIKSRINIILEELMIKMFHPNNFNKFKDWGFDEF